MWRPGEADELGPEEGGVRKACEEVEARIREILRRLRLELYPEKTRRVELSQGRQDLDFLGCHLSGPNWEKKRRRMYFLERWPSQRTLERMRQCVKALTGRNRNGIKDVQALIRDISPVLRGWGNYFRTGNVAAKFNQVDTYVWRRLHHFIAKHKDRHLRAGSARTV